MVGKDRSERKGSQHQRTAPESSEGEKQGTWVNTDSLKSGKLEKYEDATFQKQVISTDYTRLNSKCFICITGIPFNVHNNQI